MKTPFLLVLSDKYDAKWDLAFEGGSRSVVLDHVIANGYANGWIVDPAMTEGKSALRGRLYLSSLNYLYIGAVISTITLAVIIVLVIRSFFGRHYEEK